MTDYLTRVVKRTLGLLPVAQPLITPSFSSFNSKMYNRPQISFNDNVALFDQQVIPEKQEQKVSQAFSKPRSKVQKISRSRNEISLEKPEHFGAGNANNSLLPLKETGSNIQDQSHPESNFISQDTRSISQSFHNEKQVRSKDTVIVTEEPYEVQESVTLSDQAPEHLKNSRHRRNPEMMGSRIEKEMTGSITDKEIKDIIIPDLTSDFNTETQSGIDFLSQKNTNKKSDLIRNSDLIRKSNLNNKPYLNSFGQELKSDYPGKTDILDEPEKLISNVPPPGRVTWPGDKDRSLVKNQENYKLKKKNSFKNVIDPVIKISPTIKVTIGRVEVRAVPPQPVFSSSPAMKKPALSLDEYLKQHNG